MRRRALLANAGSLAVATASAGCTAFSSPAIEAHLDTDYPGAGGDVVAEQPADGDGDVPIVVGRGSDPTTQTGEPAGRQHVVFVNAGQDRLIEVRVRANDESIYELTTRLGEHDWQLVALLDRARYEVAVATNRATTTVAVSPDAFGCAPANTTANVDRDSDETITAETC